MLLTIKKGEEICIRPENEKEKQILRDIRSNYGLSDKIFCEILFRGEAPSGRWVEFWKIRITKIKEDNGG